MYFGCLRNELTVNVVAKHEIRLEILFHTPHVLEAATEALSVMLSKKNCSSFLAS
jgi:hypothetical protein